jgi:hypothetical protein
MIFTNFGWLLYFYINTHQLSTWIYTHLLSRGGEKNWFQGIEPWVFKIFEEFKKHLYNHFFSGYFMKIIHHQCDLVLKWLLMHFKIKFGHFDA